jgi:uncharacterized UPF0160 family protein
MSSDDSDRPDLADASPLAGAEEEAIPEEADPPPCEDIAIPTIAFSAEEAFAVMFLHWAPRYSASRVVRTDDPEVYSQAGIRLSLGSYSHAQRTYSRAHNLALPGFPASMSVAGLVFVHYADEVLSDRFQAARIEHEDDRRFVKKMIYNYMIEELDRGVIGDLKRLATALDPIDDPDVWVKQNAFEQLIELIQEQFNQKFTWILRKLFPARAVIRKAVQDRKKTLASGEILVIPHYVPIELHKDLIGGDEPKKHQIKYITMPRLTGDFGVYALRWRQNFRKLKYAGYRDENLNTYLTGMSGALGWIHQAGAVGAWSTQQAAIDYLKQILKQPEKLPTMGTA